MVIPMFVSLVILRVGLYVLRTGLDSQTNTYGIRSTGKSPIGMRSIQVKNIVSYCIGRGRNVKRWRRLWLALKTRGRIRNRKRRDYKGCATILLKVLVFTENVVLL